MSSSFGARVAGRHVSDEAKTLLEEAMKLPVHKRARELETGRVRGLTWAEASCFILGT